MAFVEGERSLDKSCDRRRLLVVVELDVGEPRVVVEMMDRVLFGPLSAQQSRRTEGVQFLMSDGALRSETIVPSP